MRFGSKTRGLWLRARYREGQFEGEAGLLAYDDESFSDLLVSGDIKEVFERRACTANIFIAALFQFLWGFNEGRTLVGKRHCFGVRNHVRLTCAGTCPARCEARTHSDSVFSWHNGSDPSRWRLVRSYSHG